MFRYSLDDENDDGNADLGDSLVLYKAWADPQSEVNQEKSTNHHSAIISSHLRWFNIVAIH